ncbi:MAG: gamma-glutamyltranspeptidase / glutathione hydrolase [Alphaproteobacteria bacterium]|nr:gamma-glutamyltranspeptidase / glutathione hydrolase [Alphaproteobacteria bacterium]
MSRDFQLAGRSPVIACEGMAATSHPLASRVAIETLRAGGNAADAAVAAVAVLCVVEPHMTGIGGDCFAMIHAPGRPVWGYNGSGRAGMRASLDALLAQGMRMIAPDSIHAVTVPGAIDAWAAILAAHGRFSLDRVLAPAIHYGESGFPVAARIAWDWAQAVGKLRADAGAARHLLFDGRAPAEGDVVRLPALAQSLKTVAAQGPRAFYEGPLAQDMVATAAARGSFLAAEDFARHRGEVVAPIATNYRGLDVLELPPNTQGLTALVLLNILERFDLAALDPLGTDRFHLTLEAARLAYAVRDTHIADPAAMRVSPLDLLDKNFAAKLAARIDRATRVPLPRAPSPGDDTVYLTVVDRDRMAVSLINTLYSTFGVGVCTEKTGIMLTNRGACFVLDPDHPNAFGPGKRPMHTIIPALAFRAGRCELSFGVMGAHYQPMGHAQVITNMVDYGMDVQAAIDAPRAFFLGDSAVVERGLPEATVDGLLARHHDVIRAPSPWGGAQAIGIDWQRGVLIGGSDPRKDGCALGY